MHEEEKKKKPTPKMHQHLAMAIAMGMMGEEALGPLGPPGRDDKPLTPEELGEEKARGETKLSKAEEKRKRKEEKMRKKGKL